MYRSFYYFLKAFLSLNRDKYLALYWRFCVRISFILLLIEWSELDPNVRSQTLVETFDRANHNSILEYNAALITLLTYPVSTCIAERSFSGIKSLQTPLQRTMTDERLNSLSILHIHKHKDITDIIDALQQSLPVCKVHISPFTCNDLDGASLFYPFFAVTSL